MEEARLITGICRWLFLLISLSTWTTLIDSKEMKIVCYYTNWSVYRPGQAKFSPQNINPYLCTHLIYAFGGFTKENTLKPFDKYQDIEKGGYAKFTGLKTYNKNLKTLIAIGGWNEGSSRFSPMVASVERRKELVKNTIKFLRQNHFDGLDLDWEYPTFRDGGKPRDRDNYANLVKELREEFERESEKTGRPRLLLTMAVPAGIEYINKGYDVPKLTKYLDWMNILSYDYHSAFEPAVNHHAPLYSLEEDNEYNYDAELNIDYTIKHYLKLGADPNKLVLGIPTYGRSYTLFNPDAYEIGSPADGPGDMGEATRENGYLAYYEICEYVKDQDWEVEEPNSNAMGPIAFKDNQWVGYDDENIVRKKAEYVAENSLGGIMFWAIDNDDFRGNCHGKPYPLIEAGKEALLNAYGLTEENLISPPSKPTKSSKLKSRTRSSKTTTTTTTTEQPEENSVSSAISTRRRRIKTKSREDDKSTTSSGKRRKASARKSESSSTYSSLKIVTPAYTTPAPPATPDMGGAFKCEDEGFFSHPKDCKKYFWCLGGPGDSGIVAHQFTCPAGLYFNKAADSCDYSQNVLCNKKLQKATTEKSGESASTETSQKSTLNSILSTTRAPPKITAATSKTTINFRTTTTTTEAYEDEYEYEDEDEPDKKEEPEEDPKVIKELIDLIRKAGGIEQLEKQLKFSRDGTVSTFTSDATTPSAISKSLYERVLSKTSKNALNALKKTSTRNGGGPQGSSVEENVKKADRGRLQYRTLNRQRPSTEKPTENQSDEEDSIDKEDAKENQSFKSKSSLEYVNIRRPKASTTTEANYGDDEYSRNKILGELDDEDETDKAEDSEDVTRRNAIPQYVNIRRQRPSTTEAATAMSSKYTSVRRSTVSPVDDEVEDNQEDKNYKILRRGSTTESSVSTDESTSLRYQTIRRGTTTTPTSVSNENEILRPRSTTEPSTSNDNNNNDELKGSSSRRSATTASPTEDGTDFTARYHTIRRESTTPPASSTTEVPTSTQSIGKHETNSKSTEADLSATTLAQEPISFNSTITTENLVTNTHRETTESNSNASSNTSTAGSDSLSETTEQEIKTKRPVLFQPRPFAVGGSTTAKPTTSEPSTTTVASKVSQSSFKYRVKPHTPTSTTTEPTTATLRSRTRTRFSNANRNLNEDAEQEEKYERTAENKPVRTRKRLLVTTEAAVDHNEESNRKYRPAEIADLSSLTAADLNIRGGEFVSKSRRRRPTVTTSTTERALDESEKTGARTLTLARKAIEASAFGKSRRVVTTTDDQLNASSDQASSTRKIVRGFRSTTPRTSTEESSSTAASEEKPKVAPRTRKIIRRFRPAGAATTTTETSLPETDSVSSTTSSSTEIVRKRIALFRPRQNKSTVTPNATATESSPLLDLFKTKSRFEVPNNGTAVEDNDDEDESLNEHSDVLNGEEGENIKLSESNIRESSQINSFGFDEKPGKIKFGKSTLITIPTTSKPETTTTGTTSHIDSTEMSRTEPTRIIRTRKIIRKLGTTTSTEPTTGTTTSERTFGRKRKILRRLRPAKINDLEAKPEKKDDQSSTKKYAFRVRSTTEPPEETSVKKRIFRGRSTTTEPSSSVTPVETFESTRRNIFRNRGTTTEHTTSIKPEQVSENLELVTRNNLFRGRTTTEATTATTPVVLIEDLNRSTAEKLILSTEPIVSAIVEEVKSPVTLKPSFVEKTTETAKTDEEEKKFEPNRFRVFRPTTESYSPIDTPKFDLYSPSSFPTMEFEDNDDDDEEHEDQDDDEDEDIDDTSDDEEEDDYVRPPMEDGAPKYTIYTTSLINRTHKFESNTNFNDDDEGDIIESPKQNKTVILTTALNSLNESKKILDAVTGEEVSEEKNNGTTSEVPKLLLGVEEANTSTEAISDLLGPEITSLISNTITEKNNLEFVDSNNDITAQGINALTQESSDIVPTTIIDDIRQTTLRQAIDDSDETFLPDDFLNPTAFQDKDESTAPTQNNARETTTEYRRRSTLRSAKDRPRLGIAKRTTETAGSPSTTESVIIDKTRKAFTRTFGKDRLKKAKTPSTTSLPLNNLLYRYSTTESNYFDHEDDDHYHHDEENESNWDLEDLYTKSLYSTLSTTPRIANRPIDPWSSSNIPKFVKSSISSTTEGVLLEDLGVDTEAIKNRNKNLFSKRKMNTPVLFSSTAPAETSSENVDAATPPSSAQTDSTDPTLTTLHHIFAEIEDADTTTESMSSPPSTSPGKVERLIEVNRIVEVKTKQAGVVEEDAKVESIPTVDKIGEISRVTFIKIVDGNNETIYKDPESNEITASVKPTAPPSKYAPIQIAKVEEIPASNLTQNISLKNFQFDLKMSNDASIQRQDRKFEIFGESKVANSKELGNPAGKPEIIDGISHINLVTPKPLLVTEASTISLQGLFQTEKPHLNPGFTANDEVLETGRSEFVNVRVLDQDTKVRLDKSPIGSTNFIPIRVLPQDDEESTVKAQVVEISPKPDSRTIKIVPIRVEMARSIATFPPKQSGVKT